MVTRRTRSTKIVATVGPASNSPQMLKALFEAGVDVFRLNFSHGTQEDHGAVLARIRAQPQGRLLVRGSNGSGKSTLLVALKAQLGSAAYYWPTSDKLAFAFLGNVAADEEGTPVVSGFSSGERQLKSLQEIVNRTHAAVYLLDEWDANLDAKNRASAESLVAQLAARAVVVEISHRDRV